MLTVEDALSRILIDVPSSGTERVSLHDAHGRILAEDLRSPRNVPPWDNSAMDGYAVRAADTADGEVTLELLEIIGAGSVGAQTVRPGTASGIMTGAPVPEGADAVVMVEKTDGSQDGTVTVHAKVPVGNHIRRKGEDAAEGDVVLEAGTRLSAGRVGLAASLGFPELAVARRPRVAILSTGDEVVEPGTPLGPGQIYSSNTYALAGLVRETGAVPVDHGNAPDDLDALVERLRACLEADVVLTTGGVSVGTYDFVKEAFQIVGVEMDFWKVAMKPGKPLAFGRLEQDGRVIPLFGLPGNPVSCMVNYLQYARPWVLMSMGAARPHVPVVDAVMAHDHGNRPGRAKLVRVTLERSGGQLRARTTGSQSSGMLSSMAIGVGLMMLGADCEGVTAGDPVRVQLFDPWWAERDDRTYEWV